MEPVKSGGARFHLTVCQGSTTGVMVIQGATDNEHLLQFVSIVVEQHRQMALWKEQCHRRGPDYGFFPLSVMVGLSPCRHVGLFILPSDVLGQHMNELIKSIVYHLKHCPTVSSDVKAQQGFWCQSASSQWEGKPTAKSMNRTDEVQKRIFFNSFLLFSYQRVQKQSDVVNMKLMSVLVDSTAVMVCWPNPMVSLCDDLTLCDHNNDVSDGVTMLVRNKTNINPVCWCLWSHISANITCCSEPLLPKAEELQHDQQRMCCHLKAPHWWPTHAHTVHHGQC